MKKQDIILSFNNEISYNEDGKHKRDGLSSAIRTENNLWVCCDEGSSLERLTFLGEGKLGNHKTFNLNEYIEMPLGSSEEVDLEGLGIHENKYIWVVGSHSLTRKKPKKSDPPEKQIKRLAKVKEDPKRYLLARIPIVKDELGNYDLCKICPDNNNKSDKVTAAQLERRDRGNQLMEALENDEHFKDFLKIPGKDNGFDIEGLAVYKEKIFIGVRGPVLRGWAIILEIQVEDIDKHYFQLKPGSNGKLYKKHFLHLEGMGIRDLRVINEDLLILAGPSMDLDGTISVYRWRNGIEQKEEAIVHRKDLERLFDVPHGSGENSGHDKAEGMALLDQNHVLIVFDTPTNKRKLDDSSVIGDVYQV